MTKSVPEYLYSNYSYITHNYSDVTLIPGTQESYRTILELEVKNKNSSNNSNRTDTCLVIMQNPSASDSNGMDLTTLKAVNRIIKTFPSIKTVKLFNLSPIFETEPQNLWRTMQTVKANNSYYKIYDKNLNKIATEISVASRSASPTYILFATGNIEDTKITKPVITQLKNSYQDILSVLNSYNSLNIKVFSTDFITNNHPAHFSSNKVNNLIQRTIIQEYRLR